MALGTSAKNMILALILFITVLKTVESEECIHFVNTTNLIQSPSYPYDYPNNYKCSWMFETTPDCLISLKILDFELESSNNCTMDYVALYDGKTTNDPLLKKFCGTNHDIVTLAKQSMLLVFRTDGSETYKGFKAIFYTTCFRFISSAKEVVTSPNYPNYYPDHFHSFWIFKTYPDDKIKLVFDFFELQRNNNDVVELYNGDDWKSHHIGNFSGTKIPKAIVSTGQSLSMTFRSDNFNRFKGFRATLSRVSFIDILINAETERNLTRYILNTIQHRVTITNWNTDITRTAEVAVVLFLNDPGFFAAGNKTGEEIAYELTLQLMSKLVLKKRISKKDLALFVNAMTVACMNPKKFFGVNIVAELRRRIDSSNHTNPFFMLALCKGGESMKMEDVDKLRKLFHAHLRPSWTEIQAMVVMALKCISKQPDMNLNNTLTEMVSELKTKQQINGTVDNLKNTALVVQALLATENYHTDFNMTLAITSMLQELKHSNVGFEELYYILPTFKMKTLLDISLNHCADFIKTETEETTELRKSQDQLIQIQISIILGNDMDFSRTWRIKVPSNYSLYQVLEEVSYAEPDFTFRYVISDGKPYVAGIASFQDSIAEDLFWLIYRKTRSSADDPVLVEKSPVDIIVDETSELILWYRSGFHSGSSTQEASFQEASTQEASAQEASSQDPVLDATEADAPNK